MKVTRIATALALAALVAAPATLRAQDDAPPETRVITITSFNIPGGEEGQKVLSFFDDVVAPQARNNPNVLSYRVAQHYWGSNSSQMLIIAEYSDWNAVEADCGAPCDAWTEANVPAEGTPEREEFDDMAGAYGRAFFAGHQDEIYLVNMNRAKN